MAKPGLATCQICNGSGWVTDNTAKVARPCSCRQGERKKQRSISASIPKRYEHCTIDNFNDRANVTFSRAKRRIQDFIDTWPAADRGLLLMGSCGVGKTHLAVSVLQEIISAGKPGKLRFANFQDLIQEIQASFRDEEAPSKSEILAPLIEADLLVLDELGSQKPTPFVHDVLYFIINSRYNDQKITIFTTNYLDDSRRPQDEKLEDRVGERLRSRLYEMAERVVLDGEDYRRSVTGRRV